MDDETTDDIRRRAHLCVSLTEDMACIDEILAPVRLLQKLSSDSEFGTSTFATSQFDTLAQITVDLVDELRRIQGNLKEHRTSLERLSDFHCPTTPCLASEIKDLKHKIENIVIPEPEPSLVSEISELKSKIDNIVTSKPEPLDFSKIDFTTPIAQAVAKTQPVSSVHSEKQLKQSNEEQLRSNNLIIYNVSYDKPVMALEYAKDYFNSCGLASYHLEQNKIVDAQFLSRSEDKRTCNLRVVMSNPWVVRALLSDAKKLKTTDSKLFRGSSFDFGRSYISKDMTKSEQDKHKVLISELKLKISEDDSTRWVIRNGRVQAGGVFIKRS